MSGTDRQEGTQNISGIRQSNANREEGAAAPNQR